MKGRKGSRMGSRLGVKWESSWSRMVGRIPLLVNCQLQIVTYVGSRMHAWVRVESTIRK